MTDPKSYRSFSLLSLLLKAIEKSIYNQTQGYL